jgi:acetyl/propionyl-CoA carboxylase alpha subunit
MSKVEVTLGGHTFEIEVNLNQRVGHDVPVIVNGQILTVTVPDLDAPLDQMEWIIVDRHPHEIVIDPDLRWLRDHTGLHFVEVRDLEARVTRPVSRDGRIKAPIPGQIKAVFAAAGDRVEAGQPLFILEAMKMENEIHAPKSGVVNQIAVKPGQDVMLHEVLAEIS